MSRTPNAPGTAEETLAYCTSCKMDLNHVVVAMKGDRIAKVQCRTCNKEHVYRAPKGITEPPKKKATKKGKGASDQTSAGNTVAAEWEKLMGANKAAPFKPYTLKGHYLLGDKLNHPHFGEGIVGKLIYPNKIEVIFKNEIKVLIHGGVVS